ncbi:tetratricopeptide repeat protein [uncultured Porphyromonas sp.]|uniref:tetratricopeptide repeat protein n=1 Tax=uncultured Porphyromonas sp. TaxID=159274 RepID=UPI00262087C7|nr:tetratricopeptide repeat protein [uncultured Porphyromonas sp.]
MKRLLILPLLLLSFALGGLAFAQESTQADSIGVVAPSDGAIGSSDIKRLMDEAATAYGEQKYRLAISIYEKCLSLSPEPSAELYYNLGCAYYKDGQLSSAILSLERAYRLDPSDSDTRYNLNFLADHTAEKVEQPRSQMLSRILDSVTHWFALPVWMSLALGSFVVFVLLIFLFTYGRSERKRRIGFYAGLVALVLCIVLNLFVYRSYRFITDRSEAILTAPVITLQSSPDSSSQDIAVVHEGHKVRVLDRVGGYAEIRLADGTVGWVPEDTFDIINDFSD